MAVAQRMVDEGVFAVIGPYNSAVGVENLGTYLDAGCRDDPPDQQRSDERPGLHDPAEGFPDGTDRGGGHHRALPGPHRGHDYDPQTYTAGIASQLRDLLAEHGTEIVLYETSDPDQESYVDLLRRVEQHSPDLVYVQTYYPQGGLIAKELQQMEMDTTCFMGLANQDPAFVEVAGMQAAQACSFSGVPSPEQFPDAEDYVAGYRETFDVEPGTWGTFTYDSMKLLFDAVERAGDWDADEVNQALTETEDYEGSTGSITIDPSTGNRVDVPVVILRIDEDSYVVDPDWAEVGGFDS